MENKKKVKQYLPSLGWLGLILSIIALAVQTRQNNKLAKYSFQNDLIKTVLTEEGYHERKEYIKLLSQLQLLSDTSKYNLDSFSYNLAHIAGTRDGRASLSINNSIIKFYTFYNRTPQNLIELSKVMSIKKSLEHFNFNLHYMKKSGNSNEFHIRYPGEDGFLFTQDDKIYRWSEKEGVGDIKLLK